MKPPLRDRTVKRMMYRNKREYEQALKNLETSLQDGARKVKRDTEADSTVKTVENPQ